MTPEKLNQRMQVVPRVLGRPCGHRQRKARANKLLASPDHDLIGAAITPPVPPSSWVAALGLHSFTFFQLRGGRGSEAVRAARRGCFASNRRSLSLPDIALSDYAAAASS